MTVVCYPVKGKQKAVDICEAFAAGCGGTVCRTNELQPGDAFFYGVNETNAHIWKQVIADKSRTFYYCDNSYFDSTRQLYFRITKNALQHSGLGTSNCERFDKYGIIIKPWRSYGSHQHIVLVQQSDSFMSIFGNPRWLDMTINELNHLTARPIVVRQWNRQKNDPNRPLIRDLWNAHALVTWSSAAAINAVLAGVPVVTMGQCAAEPFSTSLTQIDSMPCPELDRHNWAGVLADNQWTLIEMQKGIAWQALNR